MKFKKSAIPVIAIVLFFTIGLPLLSVMMEELCNQTTVVEVKNRPQKPTNNNMHY